MMDKESHPPQQFQGAGMSQRAMDAGLFCYSCEKIFTTRKYLEEHICSSVIFICSCGTEFTEYKNMFEHSTMHEPGYQILHQDPLKKRRIQKCEEEKLNRLMKSEGTLKPFNSSIAPSVPLPGKLDQQLPNTSSFTSPVPQQVQKMAQLPELQPSLSGGFLPSKSPPVMPGMQNIFSSVSAPTVDLWTLYQPVVLIRNTHKITKKPYMCGKCGQEFMSKAALVYHHSSHASCKISGCIGCGLLLSAKKSVPRFHACKSPNSQTKYRLVTAKPPGYKPPSEGNPLKNLFSLPLQAASVQKQNASRALPTTSTTALKNQNMRTYSNRGPQTSSVHSSINRSVSKSGAPFPVRSQVPVVFSQGLQPSTSSQANRPTNSPSVVSNKPNVGAANKFPCRVCHLPFETAQLLQRHKCAKAHEFMAKHMASGKRHTKFKQIATVQGSNLAQVNGERKQGFSHGTSTPGNLDKGKPSVVAVNGAGSDDDDCYIVEGESGKPAEVIYKVTSSVPIKI